MRCVSVVLAVCLLSNLYMPAGAATAHRARPRHYEVVRPTRGTVIPPGWYKFPGYPPIPPEENRNLDPSNFGGG
jgi:hypothetical protein